MNLYEAKKILNGRGCRLLRESTVYKFASPELYIQVEADGQLYNAYGVTATGELTAGCGDHGDPDEFEIDPMSVMPEVEYWTDSDGNEVEETDELLEALCERLAEADLVTDWIDPDMEEYHLGESVSRNGRALNESVPIDDTRNYSNAVYYRPEATVTVNGTEYTACGIYARGDIDCSDGKYDLLSLSNIEVDYWEDENGEDVEGTDEMFDAVAEFIENDDFERWELD